VLAGVAALAVRSGSMATLLQQSAGPLQPTFAKLAAEAVALAAVLVGAVLVIALIRLGVRRIVPNWVWADAPPGPGRAKPNPKGPAWASAAGNLAGCVIVQLAVGIIALVLTFRSTETGQIAFALIASFLAAALVAHQTFPVASWAPFCAAPLLIAVALLAMGGATVEGAGPEWRQALMVAKNLPLRAALPVHWLGLGCGGAVAGLWISLRMKDAEAENAAEQ